MGRLFRWVLLIAVLIIFASGGIAFYTVFISSSGDVTVPPLREMSITDAVAEIERLGLTVKIEQVNSSLPEGRVLAQNPEPGIKARKSKVIILQVSSNSERRPVPDVRGQRLERAKALLQEQGFTVGDIVSIQDRTQQSGAIIAQTPAAPSNVPLSRKIDLLVNDSGAGDDGKLTVPDVFRMSEREAREVLASSKLRVLAVDLVYSPMVDEGLVIGTRPEAGAQIKVGDGIRLKIASQQKPAGFDVTAAAKQKKELEQPAVDQGTAAQSGKIVVSVPGREDVLIGDDPMPDSANTGDKTVDPNVSVYDQPKGPKVIRNPVLPGTPPKDVVQPDSPADGKKTADLKPGQKAAKVRYQVPPLAQPLDLKIELADPSGTKVLLNRKAKSGEFVSIEAPYSKECVVTVYLGGEFVWQDKFK